MHHGWFAFGFRPSSQSRSNSGFQLATVHERSFLWCTAHFLREFGTDSSAATMVGHACHWQSTRTQHATLHRRHHLSSAPSPRSCLALLLAADVDEGVDQLHAQKRDGPANQPLVLIEPDQQLAQRRDGDARGTGARDGRGAGLQ